MNNHTLKTKNHSQLTLPNTPTNSFSHISKLSEETIVFFSSYRIFLLLFFPTSIEYCDKKVKFTISCRVFFNFSIILGWSLHLSKREHEFPSSFTILEIPKSLIP